MTQVDYDAVAPEFDRRYAHNTFAGIERALARFVARTAPAPAVVIEIGCGTGHWLAFIAPLARAVVGVDRSWAMLERARMTASGAMLARATAEHLAFATGGFDRAFCINALHHFNDQRAFMKECRRILRPGGAFLSVGLDPHAVRCALDADKLAANRPVQRALAASGDLPAPWVPRGPVSRGQEKAIWERFVWIACDPPRVTSALDARPQLRREHVDGVRTTADYE